MNPISQHPAKTTFYHLYHQAIENVHCNGLACFVARQLEPEKWKQASQQKVEIHCLGKCYQAPASVNDAYTRPVVESYADESILLKHIEQDTIRSLEQYEKINGYKGLEKALRLPPEQIIEIIEKSELRGRGGAGFPAGKKWRSVFAENSKPKYVVANADEGDAGAYIDKIILEDNPHCIIEAMTIAGYAVGAQRGYIYIRKEYPDAITIFREALSQARDSGLLGERILDTSFSFAIDIVIGHGSYVCGEETALINSIEGRHPFVRIRPPFPSQSGLFGKPTLVNNIETLANIQWIVDNGYEAYRSIGYSKSRGTKLISINSLFNNPGLYEIDFGIPVRFIIEDIGGGLKTGEVKGVIIGGPLAGVVAPGEFDTPFDFEELKKIGANVGHGGIIAFDEHTNISDIARHVFSFAAFESCGKCTPCRLGSEEIEDMLGKVRRNGNISPDAKTEFLEITEALKHTSLCGHGTGLAQFSESITKKFSTEFETWFS